MKQRYVIIDVEKCIGCFNCLQACKDEHVGNDWLPVTLPQQLHEQYWLTTRERVRGQHPMVDVAYLTETCYHCENPPCVAKSDGLVYRRPDGIVLIDQQKVREKVQDMASDRESPENALTRLCPYGKISWNREQRVIQKCTLCAHLLDEGWQQPRCAQACPLGALRLVHMDPEEMAEFAAAEALEYLRPELASVRPHVYYKNLSRFTRCFIGGSVAYEREGKEECLENCRVSLKQNDVLVAEQRTDGYGEFKFDGLEPESGSYTLIVEGEGFSPVSKEVRLQDSVYIGLIKLS